MEPIYKKYNYLPPHSLAFTVVRGSTSCGLWYISVITVESKQYNREERSRDKVLLRYIKQHISEQYKNYALSAVVAR